MQKRTGKTLRSRQALDVKERAECAKKGQNQWRGKELYKLTQKLQFSCGNVKNEQARAGDGERKQR